MIPIWLIMGMVLGIILLCVLIDVAYRGMVRKRGQDHGTLTKDLGQDKGTEAAQPERHQSWIPIIQASKDYSLDRSWIYRRVRKGVIPGKIEDGRIVVLVGWFKERATRLELAKVGNSYVKQDFISQRILPKEYGDGKTTRLQRIESNTDAR